MCVVARVLYKQLLVDVVTVAVTHHNTVKPFLSGQHGTRGAHNLENACN